MAMVHGFYEGQGSPREVGCWPRCEDDGGLHARRRRGGRRHWLVSAVCVDKLQRKGEAGGGEDGSRWVRVEEGRASVEEKVWQVGVVR